ncbi:hypothetical protein [Helicobacter rodentium]|nr:hypothetical protein [Helicobacter rodentium]
MESLQARFHNMECHEILKNLSQWHNVKYYEFNKNYYKITS